MHETPPLVTRDKERTRLIIRLREDLKKQAVVITHQTIERLIDAYDARTNNR